jgi:hypothetical protein
MAEWLEETSMSACSAPSPLLNPKINQLHEIDKMFCLKSEKYSCNILGITARQWVRQLMQFPRIIVQLKHNVGNCVKNANKESTFARQMYFKVSPSP